jgi:hypothetical protein
VDPVPDVFNLEDIGQLHGIAAAMFVPFAIVRLRDDPGANETLLTVVLREIGKEKETTHTLRVCWRPESVPIQPFGVQANTVTEWAALGVACAVIFHYAGLRVSEVAMLGDRFDFWVTDGERQIGLEVSGTMTEDVEARHREKVRQLRDNPYRANGYVVAVGFATRTVIFSFHRRAEIDE